VIGQVDMIVLQIPMIFPKLWMDQAMCMIDEHFDANNKKSKKHIPDPTSGYPRLF